MKRFIQLSFLSLTITSLSFAQRGLDLAAQSSGGADAIGAPVVASAKLDPGSLQVRHIGRREASAAPKLQDQPNGEAIADDTSSKRKAFFDSPFSQRRPSDD